MDRGDDFVLVEALPSTVYDQARLPGALNLPVDQISQLAPKLFPDRSTDIVVYCAGPGCISSRRAVRELTALGYTRVRHYVGGKKDWFDAGLRIEVISSSRKQPRKPAA
jgi:rhodanese-related sulfurtransferase